MENTPFGKILLIDDQKGYLQALRNHLMDGGRPICILTAENGAKGLSILRGMDVDLIVTDLHMPVMDGFRFVSEAKRRHPDIPIIVMSTTFFPETEGMLREMGVLDCIDKFDVGMLTERILASIQD